MASFFYRSYRVGKGGKQIELLKIRTLKEVDTTSSFAQKDQYLWYGKFLRKTKIDELPQLWNILKGDIAIFGYRPEEARTMNLLPDHMRETLLATKPGLLDLASLHFFDEETLMQLGGDPHEIYWQKIRPIKYALQVFYIQNRSVLLNIAIMWIAVKKIIGSLFKR
jgi:lipopolysaccharide/colanic/teichoic acid biosynthesis glycosyltransferase